MQYVKRLFLIVTTIIVTLATPATALAEAATESSNVPEPAASESAKTDIPSESPAPAEPQPELPAVAPQVVADSQPQPVAPQSFAAIASVPPSSQVVVTEVRLGGAAVGPMNLKEYVTLTNITDSPISLANWQLQYAKITFASADCQKDTWTTAKSLNGTVAAHQSVTIGIAMNDAAAGSVRVMDAGQVVHDVVGWGSGAPCFETTPATQIPANDKSLLRMSACDNTFEDVDTDNNAADFTVGSSLTIIQLPECTVPPEPPKVNYCEGLRLSEIGANSDEQFIELQNTTTANIDITGCKVQTNRSTTKSFIFGEEVMSPGTYRSIAIKDTELTLTKTTTGTVYLLSSDAKTEIDSQTYSNLASGTSWAKLPDGWQQTYITTPGSDNIAQLYLPCDEGYVRNESTGRCNKIVVVDMPADCGEGKYRSEETGRCRVIPTESVLAACKLGQYRSEETNRCRNLVTASAVKPCKDGQYRSEETNRCRNIATASATLKPCKENQYRSEETNRCRNLPTSAVPKAAYAVEPVKDGAKAFVGWWALGGIACAAVGYAAWEWRSEVRAWIRSIMTVGRR